jgi:hypothetical protein
MITIADILEVLDQYICGLTSEEFTLLLAQRDAAAAQ